MVWQEDDESPDVCGKAIILVGLIPIEQWLQRHPEAGSSHTRSSHAVRQEGGEAPDVCGWSAPR
jgi:hypothetical protein